MQEFTLENHAASFLPEGKKWQLVWHDEFDGTVLDETKWGFRLNFWGRRLETFTTEGVELDGQSHLRLHMIKKGDDYYSPTFRPDLSPLISPDTSLLASLEHRSLST